MAQDDEHLLRSSPHGYIAVRIGSHSCSWAVIEEPSGAIALDPHGDVIMRLTKPEAVSLAAQMTDELRKHIN